MSLLTLLPDEFKVKLKGKRLCFTFPFDRMDDFLSARSKYLNNISVCYFKMPKKKSGKISRNVLKICGGSLNDRYHALLFILEDMDLFHTPELLPFPLSIIRLFKPDINPQIKRDEFNAINDPHLTPFTRIHEFCIPQITSFNLPLKIDQASFILVTQVLLNHTVHRGNLFNQIFEFFDTEKHILRLNLPTLVPVCFQFTGNVNIDQNAHMTIDKYEIEVSFANFEQFTAAQIREQFQIALRNITQFPSLRISFHQCDAFFLNSLRFSEVSMIKSNLLFSMLEHVDTVDSKNTDTDLFAIVPPDTENPHQLLEAFRAEIPKIFKYYCLSQCTICNSLFNPCDGSICQFPNHIGNQIPFQNGQMEDIRVDPTTHKNAVYQNWSCCGECIQNSPCKYRKVNLNGHRANPQSQTISSFKVSAIKPFVELRDEIIQFTQSTIPPNLPPMSPKPWRAEIVKNPNVPKNPIAKRFACISDVHGACQYIKPEWIYPSDFLLVAGDFTKHGEEKSIRSTMGWIVNFPAQHRVIIPGNHDMTLEPHSAEKAKGITYENAKKLVEIPEVTYLVHQATTIDGINIFGTPYYCGSMAYSTKEHQSRHLFDGIPYNTDILLSHGPPYSIMDQSFWNHQICGSTGFYRRIKQVQPVVTVFGHIHEGYGFLKKDKTLFINCSAMDQWNKIVHPIIYFDLYPQHQ